MNGRCLKEYISEGLFREHPKTCTCRICQGEDEELRRQEGVLALAAKRRRLSQAGADASHVGSGPRYSHITNNDTDGTRDGADGGGTVVAESGDTEDGEAESTTVRKLSGTGVKRKRRGRPPKNQNQHQPVWSPNAGLLVVLSADVGLGPEYDTFQTPLRNVETVLLLTRHWPLLVFT